VKKRESKWCSEWCNAATPAADYVPNIMRHMYFCTLRRGHAGNHIAHVGGHGQVVHEWTQEKGNDKAKNAQSPASGKDETEG
jgi:hypothetical protein